MVNGLEITSVVLDFNNAKGKTLALVSITLNGCFFITGIKLVVSANGLFIVYPTKGNDMDYCFPISRIMRDYVSSTIILKYHSLKGI
jgi:DNA-binding cell septation regulator SpoVG